MKNTLLGIAITSISLSASAVTVKGFEAKVIHDALYKDSYVSDVGRSGVVLWGINQVSCMIANDGGGKLEYYCDEVFTDDGAIANSQGTKATKIFAALTVAAKSPVKLKNGAASVGIKKLECSRSGNSHSCTFSL